MTHLICKPPETGTQPHVTFTPVGMFGLVVAELDGNSHHLEYVAGTGNVYLDDTRQRVAANLSRHAFETFAHDYFHDLAPAWCDGCGRGAGWQHSYGWTADGVYGAIPTGPCATCNPQAVAS